MNRKCWRPDPRGVFIVAEAGVNHNGDIRLAKKLVDAAVEAGVNAVKFQTFKAEKVVTQTAPKAQYQKRAGNKSESQYQMIKPLELSAENHLELYRYCKKRKIQFLSTPFDEGSADLLERLGLSLIKISSGEITNFSLIKHIAKKGRPLIVSTGMSTLKEVEDALKVIYRTGNKRVVLLHCVSNYPANPCDVNLYAMKTMAKKFNIPIGYSDHTLGIEVALAAVALGACVIEKHFTISRKLSGPDHRASLEPGELGKLVQGIRTVEKSLGNGIKAPVPREKNIAKVARRSLVARCHLPHGTRLAEHMIDILRPGTGLPPSLKPKLIGRKLCRELKAGELFKMGDWK